MQDFLGKELNEGDYVAVLPPHYRHMVKGKVVGFTKKQIVIEYFPLNSYHHRDVAAITRREPHYVSKIGE
jgi:hypothetical protein